MDLEPDQHPARARRLPHRVPPPLPQLHDGGEPAARQEAEEGKQVQQFNHRALHTGISQPSDDTLMQYLLTPVID